MCSTACIDKYENDKTKTKRRAKDKAPSHCGADPSTFPAAPHSGLSPEGLRLGPLEHLAYHSIVGDTTRYDLSSLRQFHEPSLAHPVDLNRGKQLCLARNRGNVTLAHPIPLDSLLGACDYFGRLDAIRDAHVVTGRGVLVRLMIGEPLKLHVSFIDGVLYLIKADGDPQRVQIGQLAQSYHGYAFEALCTQEDPDEPFDINLDISRCVARRTLGELNVVFGAEIDCTKGHYLGDSSNFLELKVRRSDRLLSKLRRYWYLQALLMDVPEIFVGYRDKDYMLTRTATFPTSHFKPSHQPRRDMHEEFTFAHDVLRTLRKTCSSYDDWEAGNLDDIIWEASIEQGCVRQFRMLMKWEVARLRTYADGRRLGLLPAHLVDELRSSRA